MVRRASLACRHLSVVLLTSSVTPDTDPASRPPLLILLLLWRRPSPPPPPQHRVDAELGVLSVDLAGGDLATVELRALGSVREAAMRVPNDATYPDDGWDEQVEARRDEQDRDRGGGDHGQPP